MAQSADWRPSICESERAREYRRSFSRLDSGGKPLFLSMLLRNSPVLMRTRSARQVNTWRATSISAADVNGDPGHWGQSARAANGTSAELPHANRASETASSHAPGD